MSTALCLMVCVFGILSIVVGVVASNRGKSLLHSLASLLITAGVAMCIGGALLFVVPDFFSSDASVVTHD